MTEPLVELFRKEFVDLVGYLLGVSLIDDQRMPARRSRGNNIVVLESDYWSTAPRMQRNIPYGVLYEELIDAGAYDLRFLDGGLVQARYEFAEDTGDLLRSRVAFLPSPDLTPYQQDPDLYLLDEVYGDVIDPRVVAVPLRFDYDGRDEVVRDMRHPYSHLTLGQYPHCRIPLTSAITPYYFVELLLRSFYRTNDWLHTDDLPSPRARMPKTITGNEESFGHVGLPI